MNPAIGRNACAIQPAIIVEVGLQRREISRLSGERRCSISAAELVAIEHRRAIPIDYRQIERLAVRRDSQLESIFHRPSNERKISGAVRESSRTLIAHEGRFFSEQDEIEIVIVIVVDPNGPIEPALRKARLITLESPFYIPVEQRAGLRQNAQIHQAIVVEVALSHIEDARQLVETGAAHALDTA